MIAGKKHRYTAPLAFNQQRRRKPSRVKSKTFPHSTPAENLRLACDLSDLCMELRRAAQKQR